MTSGAGATPAGATPAAATGVNRWTDPEVARGYLEERHRWPHRDEAYAALCEFLPERVARVLDLGCGDGDVTARVLALHPDAEVLAVDFSDEMLTRAAVRFRDRPNVRVRHHDLDEPLPDAWGRFDTVVSAFAIHHVDDVRKRALYREVGERLTPGGVFLDLEHVASPTPELHEAFLGRFGIRIEDDDPSNRLAPVSDQLAWLADAGFGQVDCHWKWRELALLGGQVGE